MNTQQVTVELSFHQVRHYPSEVQPAHTHTLSTVVEAFLELEVAHTAGGAVSKQTALSSGPAETHRRKHTSKHSVHCSVPTNTPPHTNAFQVR